VKTSTRRWFRLLYGGSLEKRDATGGTSGDMGSKDWIDRIYGRIQRGRKGKRETKARRRDLLLYDLSVSTTRPEGKKGG